MLTQCDRCAAAFRINPAQLRQAQGFVRCGACQHVFYAVDRLLEERATVAALESSVSMASRSNAAERASPPLAAPSGGEIAEHFGPPVSPSPAAPAVAFADLPPLRHDPAHLEDVAEPEISLAQFGEAATALRSPATEAVPDPEGPRISIADLDSLHTPEGEVLATQEQQILADTDFEDPDADEPEVLQQDLAALRVAQQERRGWRFFWMTSALLLLLLLFGQIAWHLREPLLTRFPDWRAPVGRWCTVFGCSVDAGANTPEIDLIARDVRDHPRFAEALLANVTMISKENSLRRYPIIEMRLVDRAGRIIGLRRYAPEEYLDPSIDVAAGMQPLRPVFVVLELAGTHSDAVGFEFAFH